MSSVVSLGFLVLYCCVRDLKTFILFFYFNFIYLYIFSLFTLYVLWVYNKASSLVFYGIIECKMSMSLHLYLLHVPFLGLFPFFVSDLSYSNV